MEPPPARQPSPAPGPSGTGAAAEPAPRGTPRPGPSQTTPRRPRPFKRTAPGGAGSGQHWQRDLVECWKKSKEKESDRVTCFLEYLGTLIRELPPGQASNVEDELLRVVRSFQP